MEDSTAIHFSNYLVKDGISHNMVAMTGGKYSITKNALLQKLPRILQRQENISLVFFLSQDSHCILFFDVDQDIVLSDVETQIRSQLFKKFCLEKYEEDLEIFITKNTSCNKYHIYVPSVRVTKATLLQFTLDMNSSFAIAFPTSQQPLFDIAVCTGTALKIDGFNKYNTVSKQYDANTRYMQHARCPCSNKQMWDKTYLFADGTLTVLQHEIDLAMTCFL